MAFVDPSPLSAFLSRSLSANLLCHTLHSLIMLLVPVRMLASVTSRAIAAHSFRGGECPQAEMDHLLKIGAGATARCDIAWHDVRVLQRSRCGRQQRSASGRCAHASEPSACAAHPRAVDGRLVRTARPVVQAQRQSSPAVLCCAAWRFSAFAAQQQTERLELVRSWCAPRLRPRSARLQSRR